jgi:predicted ATP-binding protein involved in virulence
LHCQQASCKDWKRYRKEGNNRTLVNGNVKFKSRGDNSYSDEYKLNLSTIGSNIFNFIEKGNQFTLPVIAFYECDRLWTSKGEVKIEDSAKKQYSRFDPYLDCFHTGTDDKELSEWLFKQEMISLQKKEKTAISGAIESAVKMALEGCSGFAFVFYESRVIVKFTDGRKIPFEHLSDGQRTIVGLVCDIARRATILNPHLNNNICSTAIGIVLIDELDLHLHPSWQRTVIENLRKVFPKIQFICTTHSGFLIQSLRDSGELIMLDGVPLVEYSNKGIEDIARNMGVERPDVSALYEEMKDVAENFLRVLDREDLSPEEFHEKYREKLAESIKPYANNPAFQAVLERKYAKKTGCEL